MKVKRMDVKGRIFILHDPEHEHDSYHADMITKELRGHDLTIIKSFYAQHGIPTTMKGSAKFGRIVRALAYGSKADICAVYARERRTSLNNLIALLLRNIHRHPERALRAILSNAIFLNVDMKAIFGRPWDMARLSHRFSERGKFEEASLCLSLPFLQARYSKELDRNILASAALRQFTRAPLGFHGHLLCYDFITREFSGRDLFGPTPNCPEVEIRKSGGYYLMQITTGMETSYLYEQDGKILTSDVPRDCGFTLEKSARNHHYHIRSRLGYLCSHPTGHYELDRPVKLEWEEFSIPSVFS